VDSLTRGICLQLKASGREVLEVVFPSVAQTGKVQQLVAELRRLVETATHRERVKVWI
jgi:hypothetical protein